MKIVIFAHTPPPHHGQSYMVELMLEGFGGDLRGEKRSVHPGDDIIECYHVNCRVSSGMGDIGSMRLGKAAALLRYCCEAIWCRFRYGARTLYYIPAPGKRSALYRDWLVMLLCRPFFSRLVFHWHASGLSSWLETNATGFERWLSRLLLGHPALSIALAKANSADPRWFASRATAVVPNGIPDPCPDFAERLLHLREARIAERQQAESGSPTPFRLLFMAHCTHAKGLFDTLEGIALFNAKQKKWRAHFTVAGAFMDPGEEREFRERIAKDDLAGAVEYVGFVAGEQKKRLFEESDAICFPTYHPPESFPITLVEAAAYGLPSVVTRWRAIPEIQPPGYPAFVEPRSPEQIATALECLAVADLTATLRTRFMECFSLSSHLEQMRWAVLENTTEVKLS